VQAGRRHRRAEPHQQVVRLEQDGASGVLPNALQLELQTPFGIPLVSGPASGSHSASRSRTSVRGHCGRAAGRWKKGALSRPRRRAHSRASRRADGAAPVVYSSGSWVSRRRLPGPRRPASASAKNRIHPARRGRPRGHHGDPGSGDEPDAAAVSFSRERQRALGRSEDSAAERRLRRAIVIGLAVWVASFSLDLWITSYTGIDVFEELAALRAMGCLLVLTRSGGCARPEPSARAVVV